jgi:hypothetical protein
MIEHGCPDVFHVCFVISRHYYYYSIWYTMASKMRHDEFVLTSGMICQHLPSLDELPYIVSVVFTTALAALGLAFAPTSPTILT